MFIHTLENLHKGELVILRKALDSITITGADAKFVANLQSKLEEATKQADELEQERPPTKK